MSHRLPARFGLAGLLLALTALTGPAAYADGESASPEEGRTQTPLPGVADDLTPFEGTWIDAGPNAQASTRIRSGLYLVDLPADTEQYVEIERTIPGSRIWYSVSSNISSDTYDSLYFQASANGTQECGGEVVSSDIFEVLLSSRLFSTGKSEECSNADSILLEMSTGDGTTGTWQLLVWEEPPVEPGSTDGQPIPGAPSWRAMEDTDGLTAEEATAGTSYADAPTIEDGYYTVRVVPGRPALVQVPLTWGQHAQVVLTTDYRQVEIGNLDARWLTPLGGALPDSSFTQAPNDYDYDLSFSRDSKFATASPIVAWRSRNSGGRNAPAAFEGSYFLAIDAGTDEGLPEPGIDVRLQVQVVTDYEGTPPAYTADPPELTYADGTTVQPVADAAAETATEAADAETAGVPGPLVGGLFGAAALLLLVGGVALARTRRSA